MQSDKTQVNEQSYRSRMLRSTWWPTADKEVSRSLETRAMKLHWVKWSN